MQAERPANDFRVGAPRAKDRRPPELLVDFELELSLGLGPVILVLEVRGSGGPVVLALEVRGSDKRLKALALSAWAVVATASAALGPAAEEAGGTAAASFRRTGFPRPSKRLAGAEDLAGVGTPRSRLEVGAADVASLLDMLASFSICISSSPDAPQPFVILSRRGDGEKLIWRTVGRGSAEPEVAVPVAGAAPKFLMPHQLRTRGDPHGSPCSCSC
mmetsp:Transcript_16270/g.30015  ORF Transcript_16270/g.30015 Transcript_16270/m.30015 type:complete len:217 (+) Transcript_16270:426-1076(+)